MQSHYLELDFDGHIDNEALTRVMGTHLWEDTGMEIMRCKGKYSGADSDGSKGTFMLQGVADLFELRHVKAEEAPKGGKFLFVGRGIDAEKLKEEIKQCLK